LLAQDRHEEVARWKTAGSLTERCSAPCFNSEFNLGDELRGFGVVGGELLDSEEVDGLSFGREATELHVLEHALAQSCHGSPPVGRGIDADRQTIQSRTDPGGERQMLCAEDEQAVETPCAKRFVHGGECRRSAGLIDTVDIAIDMAVGLYMIARKQLTHEVKAAGNRS
jgi:hypothetical protein